MQEKMRGYETVWEVLHCRVLQQGLSTRTLAKTQEIVQGITREIKPLDHFHEETWF
jgi:hypothetical protein